MVIGRWRPVPAVLFLVLAGSLFADRFDGCSCFQESDDPVRQLQATYGLADVLFDGRLVAIRDALGDLVPSGECRHYPRCSYILAEFEIRDVWRGFSSKRFVVMVRNNSDCSVGVEVGMWYFVAARFASSNAPFAETGQCSGTFSLGREFAPAPVEKMRRQLADLYPPEVADAFAAYLGEPIAAYGHDVGE